MEEKDNQSTADGLQTTERPSVGNPISTPSPQSHTSPQTTDPLQTDQQQGAQSTQQTQGSQPLTPPDKPKGKKKLFVAILVLVLLVVVGGISAYVYSQNQKTDIQPANTQATPTPTTLPNTPTPTPDPIADWKTYTNTKYGYSINYPKTWGTQVMASGSGDKEAPQDANGLDIFDRERVSAPYPYGVITIQVLGLIPTYDSEFTKEYIVINGIETTKFENDDPNEPQSVIYVFPRPTNGYVEILFRYGVEDSDILTTFNQILSTFEFTDGINMSDWKTYSNSEYGISFKYPSGFFLQEWPKEDGTFSLSISDQEDYGGPLSLKDGKFAISIIVGGADFKRTDSYYGGYQWTKSVLDDLSDAPTGEEKDHKYDTNIKLSDINGANFSGVKYKSIPKEGIETEGFSLLNAALINDGKTVLINAGVGGHNSKTVFSKPYTDTFDQILSTFEFNK